MTGAGAGEGAILFGVVMVLGLGLAILGVG